MVHISPLYFRRIKMTQRDLRFILQTFLQFFFLQIFSPHRVREIIYQASRSNGLVLFLFFVFRGVPVPASLRGVCTINFTLFCKVTKHERLRIIL